MQAFPRTLGSALHTTLSAALLPLLLLCTSPAAHAQTRPQDITPGTVSPTGPGAVISGGDRSTGSNTPGNNNNSDSSCWVWVDEDWQSTPGTVIVGGVAGVDKGPHVAARTTPFNSVMGDSSTEYALTCTVNIDYATLCAGSGGGKVGEMEAVRRQNELYLGEGGRYTFSNRAVGQLPALAPAALYAALASGRITIAPQTNQGIFGLQPPCNMHSQLSIQE